MGVIFDLDLTLVDTQLAQPFRDKRDWANVYKLIPTMLPYNDIDNLIQFLNQNNIPIAIVTKSPKPYCEKIIQQWNWKIDAMVCYHDVRQRKPHPESILKAIQLLNVNACDAVSIGDVGDDITASKSAGVFSIGASWGCLNLINLQSSNPDIIINTVSELKTFLKAKFRI
jgi:HAD superfamily hydrolase (TIGR01509 family)